MREIDEHKRQYLLERNVVVMAPNFEQAFHFCEQRGWPSTCVVSRPEHLRGRRNLVIYLYNRAGFPRDLLEQFRYVIAGGDHKWIDWGSDEIERHFASRDHDIPEHTYMLWIRDELGLPRTASPRDTKVAVTNVVREAQLQTDLNTTYQKIVQQIDNLMPDDLGGSTLAKIEAVVEMLKQANIDLATRDEQIRAIRGDLIDVWDNYETSPDVDNAIREMLERIPRR